MDYSVNIKLDFREENITKSIFDGVLPEHKTVPYERSKVTFNREGSKLKLVIEAEDLSALRGTVSSYLRWISTSRKLLK